jgi:hypothetical protein
MTHAPLALASQDEGLSSLYRPMALDDDKRTAPSHPFNNVFVGLYGFVSSTNNRGSVGVQGWVPVITAPHTSGREVIGISEEPAEEWEFGDRGCQRFRV